MSNEIKIERSAGALIIRFVRPEIRNPLSVTVLEQLDDVVHTCKNDTSITALILTGADASFASGADLREIAAVTHETAPAFARKGQDLIARVAGLSKVTIAAINGFCFGGALDLTLACSRRIASPSARFAHPGAGLGIITGWGGTQRLPRLIGETNALEMFFTAEAINADRALAIGLVDEICTDPLKRSLELAEADNLG